MAVDVVVYDKVDKESEKIQDALYALYPQQTITDAAIASFADGSDGIPVKELVVGVEPVQDLHGYDNPWPAGGGKNKLQVTVTTQTINGVTFTVYEDGSVLVNGTASSDADLVINSTSVLPDGTYILSGCPTLADESICFLRSTRGISGVDYGRGTSALTYNSGAALYVYIHVASGKTASNFLFKPMIRLATETDATFAPYSNICPISGWTGAEIEGTGKNLLKNILTTTTNRGITATVNDDGTITLTGTNDGSAYSRFVLNDHFQAENGVEYTMSGAISSAIVFRNVSEGVSDTGNSINFTGTGSSQNIELRVLANTAISGSVVVKPMIRFASDTDATFEPYTGSQISVTFPSSAGTVYGCTITINPDRTGGLVVNMAITTVGALSWSYYGGAVYTTIEGKKVGTQGVISRLLSDEYKTDAPVSGMDSVSNWDNMVIRDNYSNSAIYIKDTNYTSAADFKAAKANVQICYELAEPIVYPLTESEISGILSTLYGTNNIWADCGDIEKLTYRADLGKYIDSHITTAVANAMNA